MRKCSRKSWRVNDIPSAVRRVNKATRPKISTRNCNLKIAKHQKNAQSRTTRLQSSGIRSCFRLDPPSHPRRRILSSRRRALQNVYKKIRKNNSPITRSLSCMSSWLRPKTMVIERYNRRTLNLTKALFSFNQRWSKQMKKINLTKRRSVWNTKSPITRWECIYSAVEKTECGVPMQPVIDPKIKIQWRSGGTAQAKKNRWHWIRASQIWVLVEHSNLWRSSSLKSIKPK